MGCFLACFGGDADRRRRRRKLRRQQSPARSPPRSIHVAVAREAAAHVVVKEVSPPLRGAKPSTLAEAVEVPDEVVAEAADVATNDASLPSQDVSTPSSAADDAVTDASPVKELRDLSEQKVLEKQAASSLSPVKCSPIVAAVVSPQDSVECSTVAQVVVSALDSDLREVNEHGSRSSGKKKVTFDMNVTTYENAVPPDQEEEPPEEDENYVQNTVVLPENHRYRNCSGSDDDVGDEYAEDDVYGYDSDEMRRIFWTARLIWLMRRKLELKRTSRSLKNPYSHCQCLMISKMTKKLSVLHPRAVVPLQRQKAL